MFLSQRIFQNTNVLFKQARFLQITSAKYCTLHTSTQYKNMVTFSVINLCLIQLNRLKRLLKFCWEKYCQQDNVKFVILSLNALDTGCQCSFVVCTLSVRYISDVYVHLSCVSLSVEALGVDLSQTRRRHRRDVHYDWLLLRASLSSTFYTLRHHYLHFCNSFVLVKNLVIQTPPYDVVHSTN